MQNSLSVQDLFFSFFFSFYFSFDKRDLSYVKLTLYQTFEKKKKHLHAAAPSQQMLGVLGEEPLDLREFIFLGVKRDLVQRQNRANLEWKETNLLSKENESVVKRDLICCEKRSNLVSKET